MLQSNSNDTSVKITPQESSKKKKQTKKVNNSASITLSFDLTNKVEKNLYDDIVNTHKEMFQVEGISFSIKIKDWLKYCFTPPKKRKSMDIKKQFISKELKIEIWTKGYNKANEKDLSEKDFIIDILPVISKRELERYTNLALS